MQARGGRTAGRRSYQLHVCAASKEEAAAVLQRGPCWGPTRTQPAEGKGKGGSERRSTVYEGTRHRRGWRAGGKERGSVVGAGRASESSRPDGRCCHGLHGSAAAGRRIREIQRSRRRAASSAARAAPAGRVVGRWGGQEVSEEPCHTLPCTTRHAPHQPSPAPVAHPAMPRPPRASRLMTCRWLVRAGRRWRSPSAGGAPPPASREGVL